MKKFLPILFFFFLLTGWIHAQQINLVDVIKRSAREVEGVLPQGSMVAVLNFISPSEAFSDYVIEEITGELVTGRKVTIVDRRNLALISQEMNLQLSGDVSDESAQAIGRMLGAQSIVSGTLTNMGTFYRFRVRVISVETAAIQTQVSLDLRSDAQVAFLLGSNPASSPNRIDGSSNSSSGNSGQIQAAQLREGTYTFYPRLRVNQGGVDKNLYLDRIVVRGQFLTVFFTGGPTGKAGDGEYGPFWGDYSTIRIQNLDSPGRPFNPINKGEDDPNRTNGFYLTFQGVTGTRFSLTSMSQNPPWTFDEIILGEPDAGTGNLSGNSGRIQAAQLREGTHTFYPRLRVNQGGVDKNLYLDRIVVRGQFLTVFFTGGPTGRAGDGEYDPFWGDYGTIQLRNVDSLGRPFNPINKGEDDPNRTDGFYLTFQGVTGTRFSLTSTSQNPPWTFDEIILGEPDQ